MPPWFSALSPETILVAIAAAGGVIALLLAIAAVRRMRDWEFRRGSVYLLGAAVVAALGVGGGMLAASLHTYSRLTHEQEAARAVLRALGPQRYELLLVREGEPSRRYELRGDEWQIDARLLKWGGLGSLLGFDTVYRFERLAGRYADNELERKAPRTVYALSSEAGVDFWGLLKKYHRYMPLADALYGSAAYVPMADGAQYVVSVSTTGLLIRPLNDVAKKAVGGWK
ncbi:MAG: cation/multidrug efflux pump [Betaproteobacteria bacterium]|nr:cation/multidrug efflux pump [Betaproteobacteria bacterium]